MSTTSPEKKKSVTRELITLAVPTVLEEVLSILLQYADTAMVGHLGEEATAAVSTTTTIGWLINAFLRSIGIALLAVMSKSLGEGNKDKLKKLAGQAIILVIIFGILVEILTLSLAKFIPIWMGTEEKVRPDASKYFFIICTPMIFRASAIILGSSIRATLDTKTPMIVNAIGNVINMFLDYIFIYVIDLKVTGAAIATAISFTISGTLMFIVFINKKEVDFHISCLRFDKVLLKEIAKIAIPSAGNQITSFLGYVVFAGLVSGMGTTIFAAHSLAVNAEAIFYIPGIGISYATSAMIGVAFGEKNKKRLKKIMKLSTFMTIGIMIVSGTVLYLCAYPFMRVFTSSIKAAELGAKMLKIVALTEPFFGLMVAMQGIFYGYGKTFNVFIIETFGMWGIRILFTVLCVKLWHTGLTQIWYCMIADNISKSILLAISMIIFIKGQLPKLIGSKSINDSNEEISENDNNNDDNNNNNSNDNINRINDGDNNKNNNNNNNNDKPEDIV